MQKQTYLFDDFCVLEDNNYIFQIVAERKLTSIYHCHNFYEIVMVLDGSILHQVNDARYQMKRGNFMILCPKDYHRFISQSSNAKIMSLSIEYNEFSLFATAFNNHFLKELSAADQAIMTCGQEVFDIIHACTSTKTESYYTYEYKYLLCTFIKYISEISLQKPNPCPQDLANALAQMAEPDNIRIGLPALLSLSGYSHSHLARLMKKYFHTTLHSYILNLKMEKAYNDIIFSQDSLEDISYNVGFASFSHFNKVFKEKYHITPSALRKTYRKIV